MCRQHFSTRPASNSLKFYVSSWRMEIWSVFFAIWFLKWFLRLLFLNSSVFAHHSFDFVIIFCSLRLFSQCFCPSDSSDPIKCDPGKYCQTEGLSAPTGDCLAGYFCTLQASTQTPTDGTTGDICPAGFYCETGVSTPTPCSPGTYSAGEGNTLPSDCLNCTAGEFCGSYNLTATDGKNFIIKPRTVLNMRFNTIIAEYIHVWMIWRYFD
jgi:hypothetical protein